MRMIAVGGLCLGSVSHDFFFLALKRREPTSDAEAKYAEAEGLRILESSLG